MTIAEREKLILNYMPLANKLAWQQKKITPKNVTFDELQSAAYLGLVDAAQKYDPERSCFYAYARLRIAGEIKDHLRSLIWSKAAEVVTMEAPEDLEESVSPEASDDFFLEATKCLTALGRKIVKMYYVDDLTMKEIGKHVELTEGRVSQILKECLREMKVRWKEWSALSAVA